MFLLKPAFRSWISHLATFDEIIYDNHHFLDTQNRGSLMQPLGDTVEVQQRCGYHRQWSSGAWPWPCAIGAWDATMPETIWPCVIGTTGYKSMGLYILLYMNGVIMI